MEILMGGSGSTGSSLLKNILNRHPEIFAGGETAFFSKKQVYTDWNRARKNVYRRGFKGLRNFGFHIYNGTDLLQKEYQWTKQDLVVMSPKSTSLQEFCKQFYALPMAMKEAKHWLEKTPANAACFPYFLEHFQNGKVIHITRRPYDTIASLWKRGYSLHYAVGIYLLNTASGIAVQDDRRVLTVKYENLTSKPQETVRSICSFLDVKYSADMLEPQGEKIEESQLKGWAYDETAAVQRGAVGKFGKLTEKEQNMIMEAVQMITVSAKGKVMYNLEVDNVEGICEALDYEYYPYGKKEFYKELKAMQNLDKWNRIRRGYMTGFRYPLEIKS